MAPPRVYRAVLPCSRSVTWRRYERLRKRLLLVWGAWFPFVLIAILLGRAGWQVPVWIPLLFALPWSIATVVLGVRAAYWPCPRCRNPFFLRFGVFPAYSGTCPHCGLRFGEGVDSRDPKDA